MTLDDELETATRAARAAGASLVARFSRAAAGVREKGGDPRELVSDADVEADGILRSVLSSAFPRDGILTEESGDQPGVSGRRWVVDPLDGTTNFLYGLPLWAVSIALEDAGQHVLGVVYDPVRDELFRSSVGTPTTCDGRPTAVSDAPDVAHATVSVLLRPEYAAAPEMLALTSRLRAGRELGATALELAWVAAGRLDGCVFRRTENVWDWAAGARLIQDAGGMLRDLPVSVPAAAIAGGEPLVRDATRA